MSYNRFIITPDKVTTALELPGFKVVESVGIVRGLVVRSRSIVGSFVGDLLTVVGGKNQIYTELCEQARQEAYDDMILHAQQHGANAIIGFKYDATELAPGLTEVLAYGTACRVEPA